MPLFRRAYNQLKIKVRALPTWRKPVGDGAKRTRGLLVEVEFMGLDIGSCRKFDRTGSMVRAGKRERQAALPNRYFMQPDDYAGKSK